MTSSSARRRRLDLERQLLARELPQFQLHNIDGNPYVAGWQTTSDGWKTYRLKLLLGPHYPDQMPSLYVVSPLALPNTDGDGTINDEEVSHAFHTLENGPGGCVQICHFKSDYWDASKTCVGVLMKGIVWLEAYEAHLQTGQDIADFCA